MIGNIVFDIGDVLLTYKEPSFLCQYGISENEAETVIDGIVFGDIDHTIWRNMDLGILTEKECCHKYCETFPEHEAGLKAFFEHMDDWYADNSETWKYLPELKDAGYRLYILSNWHKESFERCIRYMPFIQYMDGFVISGYEGVRKPDRKIYEILCRRYCRESEKTTFFDDKKKNIVAAEQIGITGIQVENQEKLQEEIKHFLNKNSEKQHVSL